MSGRIFAAVVAGVVGAGSIPTHAAPPSLNLAQTLAPVKNLLSAGHQADILVLGDSLSFRPGSYLPTFRSLLQSAYGNAGAGYQGLSLWTGGGFNQGWLYTGINTDNTPHRSLDGLWNRYNGVAEWPNQAVFTPNGPNVQLQYLTQPGGGSFYIRHGNYGPIVDTVHTSGPSGVATYNYSLPPGESLYTIQPVGNGSFTILGQNNVNSGPGVRVHRAANGGWGVNNFLQRDWTFDAQLGLIQPHLIMVWIGQNDQAYTQTSYATKINQLVDRLQASAPQSQIMLIGTYDQGSSALAGLVEGMADVAAQRGVGFINLYATAGNAQFFNSNGYLDDGVHFSPAGGAYMGQFLYDAFRSDGWSLAPFLPPEIATGAHHNQVPMNNHAMPEPALAGVLGAALLLTCRRRS